jgi:uncharacterized membrane protein YraQ (UPF0718 family)
MIIVQYFQAFWDYLVLTAPYLVMGLVAGGIIHEFINLDFIKKHLGGAGASSVIKASLFGIPLPLCSCSVIPTAVTLKKEGASTPATSAFLISTPESGVDSIMMTYGVMDLPMTIFRPLAAFLTATLAGFGQMLFNKENDLRDFSSPGQEVSGCSKSNKGVGSCDSIAKADVSLTARVKRVLRYAFVNLADDLAAWLFIGLALGALMNFALPEDIFTQAPAWASKLVVLLFGIPFYICASASTPIAASMMMKGMSPGTALIFLLVGPATNFTNIAVLHKYLGKKGIIINIMAIALVSFGLSFVVDALYETYGWSKIFKIEAHAHSHSGWWEMILAAFFAVLMAKGIYKEKVAPLLASKKKKGCCPS